MTPEDALRPEQVLMELLDRMRTILVSAVEGGASAREYAGPYLDVRSQLLSSAIGDMLPGFLYQCRTITRFCDFISLYDPDIELRIAFIDRMLDRCRDLLKPAAPRAPQSRESRQTLKF